MNQQGFELISTNCDVMIHIYKMLDFHNQLRLAGASDTLRSVFQDFIWKENYEIMTISKHTSRPLVALTNTSRTSRLYYTEEVLQDILRVYADKVQQLDVMEYCPTNIHEFKNLNSLSFRNMIIPKELFQVVANNCLLLENLNLICSRVSTWFSDIVNALVEMKNLKRLHIDYDGTVTIRTGDFQEIVTRLRNLEYFQLAYVEVLDEKNMKKPLNPLSLNELYLTFKYIPREWPTNVLSYATILKIKFVAITEHILRIIANSCLNLRQLTFQDTSFENINTFALPTRVSDLSLEGCRGLTFKVLKQLLRLNQLTRFFSTHNRYNGGFHEFSISRSIQSFCVEDVDTINFRLAHDGNLHFNELTWCDKDDTGHELPLASCANLTILAIRRGFIPTTTLLQLKFLRKLTISNQTQFINWSDIVALLKHPSLTDLIIDQNDDFDNNNKLEMAADFPTLGFTISLKNLKVPVGLFVNAADFFLDLFRQNLQLRMVAYYEKYMWYSRFDEIIRELIDHQYFPGDLKTIATCCYVIECAKLRADFQDTLTTFLHGEDHYLDEINNDVCFVLDRNYN